MKTFKSGDYVRRRADTRWDNDPFQCHPLSFGKVLGTQREDYRSRDDNPRLAEHGNETWLEVVVTPHDRRMAPHGKKTIQWALDECVYVGKVQQFLLRFLWPVLRLVYTRPLKGQSTNYHLPWDNRRNA